MRRHIQQEEYLSQLESSYITSKKVYPRSYIIIVNNLDMFLFVIPSISLITMIDSLIFTTYHATIWRTLVCIFCLSVC